MQVSVVQKGVVMKLSSVFFLTAVMAQSAFALELYQEEEVLTGEGVSNSVEEAGGVLKDVDNYLKNCGSDVSDIPRNETDLLLEVFGLSHKNKLGQARGCLKQRLQKVTKKICQAKEDIYTQAQKYEDDDDQRVNHVEDLHLRYQHWLADQADVFQIRAFRADSSLVEREMRAYADIFKSEFHTDCHNSEEII